MVVFDRIMTVVVAAKLKNKVIIGCDTQINYGNKKLFSYNYSKVVEIKPNFIIGFTGLNVAYHILTQFKKKKSLAVPKNVDDCYDLTRFIFEQYRDLVKNSLCFELDKEEPVGLDLLIATDQHIFTSDEFSVEEYDTYAGIGAGEDYALASMFSCYPSKTCVRKALLAACQYSDSCSQPIIIKEIERK